ncbi:MAG: CDP-diacylglycerol--glycerol-3-phosphate 3-phosphatidyltransferase [Thermodesulfovibrionales bacterium]|nr:CDP-diacylglycerol--glycerol-3-phosphate 3-phosphatidyltransferase [Thermodesulfovibrionales bacterium]
MTTINLNLPTFLTFLRVISIPFFIIITPENPLLGVSIFILASITDFLDGYIARKSGQITKFGIILDPIADKFLVISALILLVDMVKISAWIAILIIVREFLVTGLRIFALSKNIIMPSEVGGKMKAVTQMLSIIFLLLPGGLGSIYFYDIGLVLIYLAVIFTIISGIKYTHSFLKHSYHNASTERSS